MVHFKYYSLFVAIILITIGVSCKTEDQNENGIISPENLPNILQAENGLSINVDDTITINFIEAFNGEDELLEHEGNFYSVKISSLSLDGINIDTAWNGNESLSIWSDQLFAASSNMELIIKTEWSNKDGFWEKTQTINVSTSNDAFPINNIVNSYPVDKQYFFLQEENAFAFFLINKLPTGDQSFVVELNDNMGTKMEDLNVEIDEDSFMLKFSLPSLENESLYRLKLKQGNNELYLINFRTSSFNNFNEKVSSLTLGNTFRGLHVPWSMHYLKQSGTVSGEGFDEKEASLSEEIIDTLSYSFHDGLVQLMIEPEQSTWYSDFIYPIIYAPWTEDDFTLEYTTHDNLGSIPLRAIHLEFTEPLISLSPEEIESGSTSQTGSTDFNIYNYLSSVAFLDFKAAQNSVVDEYINDETHSDRVSVFLWDQYNVIQPDLYNYSINYVLPDGSITSSVSAQMDYQ